MNNKKEYEGFIDSVIISGKRYGLQCKVVTVEPIVCPKCGGSFELKYGSGKCDYCGTYYTTEFKLVEK